MVKFITTLMVVACALVFTGEASKANAADRRHGGHSAPVVTHKPAAHHLSAPVRQHHRDRVVVVAVARPVYASNYYWRYGTSYGSDPFWIYNLYSGVYSADPYFYQDPTTLVWYRYYNNVWYMHRQGAWYRYGGGQWRFAFRYGHR